MRLEKRIRARVTPEIEEGLWRANGELQAYTKGKVDMSVNLSRVAEEVAMRMGISPPTYVGTADYLNAYASTRVDGASSVSFTYDTRNILNMSEAEAIMGHELGHIKNSDSKRKQKLKNARNNIAQMAFVGSAATSGFLGLNHVHAFWGPAMAMETGSIVFSGIGAYYVAKAAFNPIIAAMSRRAEKKADIESVNVAGITATVTSLVKVNSEGQAFLYDMFYEKTNGPDPKTSPAVRVIGLALRSAWKKSNSTHPNLKHRLDNVLKYAEKNDLLELRRD